MEPGSGPDVGSGSWDPPPPLPPLWPPAPPPAASTGSAVTQWVIYLLAVVLLLGVPACVCLTARRALEKRHKRRRPEFPGKEFGDGRGHSRASSAHALAEALRKDAGLPPGPPRRRSKLPLNRFRAAGRAALAAFGAQGDARARRADAAEPVASPPPEVETEPLEDDLEA